MQAKPGAELSSRVGMGGGLQRLLFLSHLAVLYGVRVCTTVRTYQAYICSSPCTACMRVGGKSNRGLAAVVKR